MAHKAYIHAAVFGAAWIPLILANTALAQEVDPGGRLMTFGLTGRVESGQNLGLEVPEKGSGTIASTILSFGLSDETRTQRFLLDLSTALRFTNLPERESEFDLGDAILELEYERDAANSGLSLSADYLRYDIGFLRSLLTFTNDEGVISLPRDFSDLTGTGIRKEYLVGGQIDFGREDLIGFNLEVALNGIDYSEASNPDLFASDEIAARAGMTFDLSPRTGAAIDLTAIYYEDESDGQTKRDTEEIAFRIEHAISSRARLEASVGFIDIDERDEVEGDILVTGPVGDIGWQYDAPNGELSAEFAVLRDTPGRLNTLTFGRSVDIPDGAFSADVGVARDSDGEVDFIGALAYTYEFGPHEAFARINRGLGVTDNREFRPETVADLGVVFGISAVSQLGFRATYALAEGTINDPRVARLDLDAVYSRRLTQDWNFNAGVSYRRRDEEGVGRANSPLVFVALGRDFLWRP